MSDYQDQKMNDQSPAELEGVNAATDADQKQPAPDRVPIKEEAGADPDHTWTNPPELLEAARRALEKNGIRIDEMTGIIEPTPQTRAKLEELNRLLAEEIKKAIAYIRAQVAKSDPELAALIYEWASIQPFLLTELKKPKYNGMTIEELFDIAQADAGEQGRYAPDSLYVQALTAARAALKKAAQQSATPEEYSRLNAFFNGDLEFMPIPKPRGLESLQKINFNATPTEEQKIIDGPVTITFKGRMGIEEQKIQQMFLISFAEMNPYKAQTGLRTLVTLPLDRTMEILGRPTNANNTKAFARKLAKEILPTIDDITLEREYDDGDKKKKRNYEYERIKFGGGYMKVSTKKNEILFEISSVCARYLNSGNMSQCSSKALLLGTRQNPLPFFLHTKIQNHYFHDGNRARGTYNILSLAKLLKFCEDSLPSFEHVQQTDPGHWARRIREPLEAALNEIQERGLYRWEYCKGGYKEAPIEEIQSVDYRVWSKLYVTFHLIPDDPDQTERLQNKQKRIEKAKQEKEIKDAETIIKADTIQRRKERKAKKEAAKGKTGTKPTP